MLKDKINEDYKLTFKEGRESEVSVLKMIKAALLNKEKEKVYQANKQGGGVSAGLSDDETMAEVMAEVKKTRDSMALFEKGGRADLAQKADAEIKILSRYLPEQLGEGEIKEMIAAAIAQTGAKEIKDVGKLMATLMPRVKGRADSSLVGKLARNMLGQ